MTRETRTQNNDINFSNTKKKKDVVDFLVPKKQTTFKTCICCGDVLHYRNDMFECNNCDENYGTDKCKHFKKRRKQ
jgi:hypothetical protein